MKTFRLLLLLLLVLASMIVASSAAASRPAPQPQPKPICEPGDDCSPPPPPAPPQPPDGGGGGGDGGGGDGGGGGGGGDGGGGGGGGGGDGGGGSGGGGGDDPVPVEVGSWEDTSMAETGGYSTLWASGCKTIVYTRTAKTVIGAVLFRHNLRVYWCWRAGRITQVGVSCFASDTDSFTIVADPCESSSYYYGWNGRATGGYYVVGTARYGQCLFKYGCWRSWIVSVELWVNGNGAWMGGGGSS